MAAELLLIGVLGLAMGSFLTLVVERFDTAESYLISRSHCNNCNQILRWWELLPFVGYFIVRGKCVRCNAVIPRLYPVFELITGATFIAIGWAALQPVSYLFLGLELIFVSVLLILFFYDALHQQFPGSMLLVALGGSILLALVRHSIGDERGSIVLSDPFFGWLASPPPLLAHFVVGGLIGAALLGSLAFPSREKWMGYGDVFLILILGIWVGYPLVIVALLVAFYSGAVVGIWQLLSKKARKDHRLAFGPFLIFGGIVAHTWGEKIFTFFMQLWGAV